MAFGSMAPQMNFPALAPQPNLQDMGAKLMAAALAANRPTTGAPATPALFAPGGGGTDMLNGGMGNGLLSKLFPPKPADPLSLAPPAPGASAPPVAGPIDPNTGMPVTADVLAGAANQGGPGPAPNALSGMW